MSHGTEDWLQEGMATVRDGLLALVGRHERAGHGGHCCALTRLGVIAYLCHALGVRGRPALALLARQIAEYDRGCRQAGPGHDHADLGVPAAPAHRDGRAGGAAG